MTKREQFTLQRYQYNGWHHNTGNRGEIIYVDLKHKHPDPLKKLLWGYNTNGNLVHGDYVGFFTKIGSPKTFEFEQNGRTHMEEQKVRHAAIIRAIKKGW